MALKDLAATVLGTTSTAAIGTHTSTLPVISPDAHPDMLRHQRQREELATKLAAATNDLSRLERERVHVDHDGQEAAVRQLLGEEPVTGALDAKAADAAIATGQARVAALAEALRRLDIRGGEIRNTIVWAMGDPIKAAARDRIKRLATALRAASALSDELAVLERFEGFHGFDAPVRHWPELSRLNEYSKLNMWLGAAQAAGWDV